MAEDARQSHWLRRSWRQWPWLLMTAVIVVLNPHWATAGTCYKTFSEIQEARQRTASNDPFANKLSELVDIIGKKRYQGTFQFLFRRYELYSTIQTSPSEIRLEIDVPGTSYGKQMPIYVCAVSDGFEAVDATDPSQTIPFRPSEGGMVIHYYGSDIQFMPVTGVTSANLN